MTKKLSAQQKGSLLAFVAVVLITPDSLFIRLSHIDTWGLLFYRGAIPFVAVFIGLLMVYRTTFFAIFKADLFNGSNSSSLPITRIFSLCPL